LPRLFRELARLGVWAAGSSAASRRRSCTASRHASRASARGRRRPPIRNGAKTHPALDPPPDPSASTWPHSSPLTPAAAKPCSTASSSPGARVGYSRAGIAVPEETGSARCTTRSTATATNPNWAVWADHLVPATALSRRYDSIAPHWTPVDARPPVISTFCLIPWVPQLLDTEEVTPG
jgi:hypothetical protein